MIKRILKKIYYLVFYPILKILYKPIIDEIKKSSIDKSSIYGLELILRKEFINNYKILNPLESIKLLISTKQSFIRIGDGEFPILSGKSGGMHKFSNELKFKLIDSINKAQNLHLPIGINPFITEIFNPNLNNNLLCACENLNTFDLIKYININTTYFNALTFRLSPINYFCLKYPNWGGAD